MSISPTVEIIIVALCSIAYGIGNYGSFQIGEILKLVGIGGIGLVLLNLFISSCPAMVLPAVIQIAGVVILIQLAVWLYFHFLGKKDPEDLEAKQSV